MIDLTPLDVRNKRGDFKKLMRGYDPQEVDVFLELAAERLEALVRENLQLKERTGTLQQQVSSQMGREQAVQDALVTAQELRADIKAQSQREAEHVLKEAETEARRLIAEAEAQVRGKLRGVERRVEGAGDALDDLERRRDRFLKEFRQMLERNLDAVQVEEGRAGQEDRAIDLDLGPTAAVAVPEVASVAELGPDIEADSQPEASSGSPQEVDEALPVQESVPDQVVAAAESQEPYQGAQVADIVDRVAAVDDTLSVEALAPLDADVHALQGRAGATDRPEGPGPAAELPAGPVPSVLETPSFTTGTERPPPVPEPATQPKRADGLSASMEAEAVAEAGSQVFEVTGADGDALADVPRLEEVLAEAGAEFTDVPVEPVSPAPHAAEEIAPPRIGGRSELLLYLDPEEPDA